MSFIQSIRKYIMKVSKPCNQINVVIKFRRLKGDNYNFTMTY